MIDQLILRFDRALRTMLAPAPTSRPMPGEELPEMPLSDAERSHAAALMRVNHAGEVCAQALYDGQALTCADPAIRRVLEEAAREETEHLNWTERRIAELGGHKSLLNPLWYAGSLVIGAVTGRLGDRWSLGFLAETEKQVEAHLARHLALLPEADKKSRRVVKHMKADEVRHGETALRLGGRELPASARSVMKAASRIMTSTAYHV